uniref:Uncharacterized protein n=1 Tax=Phenylobacterium glaciei TaxID=2803784 RepID=A0A974P3C7_9CAUL|nr:hypothetical protein JKL49_00380 [Phenylobacterium glaciei]
MELAGKTWVDYRDFVTAYLVALGVHQEAYSPSTWPPSRPPSTRAAPCGSHQGRDARRHG